MERTAVQDYAEGIAALAMGVPKSVVCAGVDAKAIEWVIIVDMIMSILTQIMEQCQQSKAQVVASVKDPTRMQRARFFNVVKSNFDCCSGWGWRRKARDFADVMLQNVPADHVVEKIVDQCREGGF
jgi:hypothetical protein